MAEMTVEQILVDIRDMLQEQQQEYHKLLRLMAQTLLDIRASVSPRLNGEDVTNLEEQIRTALIGPTGMLLEIRALQVMHNALLLGPVSERGAPTEEREMTIFMAMTRVERLLRRAMGQKDASPLRGEGQKEGG